jgi:hypothetical protein
MDSTLFGRGETRYDLGSSLSLSALRHELRKLQLEKLFNKFKNGVKGKRTRKVRKKQKKKIGTKLKQKK